MLKIFLIVSCLLLGAPNQYSQRKQPRHKTKPDDFEKYLEPIPEDEILFTVAEQNEILGHDGWRLASAGAKRADNTQIKVYYDRARIERKAKQIVHTWLKTETRKDDKPESYTLDLFDYDCEGRRVRILASTKYKDLEQQESIEVEGNWHQVIPDSIGEHTFNVLCRDRADQEQIDMELAADWFMKARQSEKKSDFQDATFWYEAASKHAPHNRKIFEGLLRTKTKP